MDSLAALRGRTLVLVAHPDDETLGCGALMQRMREPLVTFATDGAPRNSFFWRQWGSRAAYAEVRRNEAGKALNSAGASKFFFLEDSGAPFCDQELFLKVGPAAEAVSALVEQERPEALLTLAYEGGHNDHDACNFIVSVIASRWRLPAWEMPLYHRAADGASVHQRFMSQTGEREDLLRATADELSVKHAMAKAYQSQFETLQGFQLTEERFRPLPRYDYCQPPHAGQLNYEAWGWGISGRDVSRAFSNYLAGKTDAAGARESA